MTITTTLGQLAAAEAVIQRLVTFAWPPRTAYAVRKLAAAAGAELRFWHEQRIAWVKEFGDADADGNVTVANGNAPAFLARLAELAAVDVKLACAPVPFEALELAEDPATKAPAKFSAADLLALGPLVGEPTGDS